MTIPQPAGIIPCQAIINHAAESELCGYIRVKRFKTEKKIKPPMTLEWVDRFCARLRMA
jgi:hypothetical protein